MTKFKKALELIQIAWIATIIVYCLVNFIQIFTGLIFGTESPVFVFLLSLNYLILIYQYDQLSSNPKKN